MNEFLEILSQNEMIIIYILIFIMGILMLLVLLIDKNKSHKHNIKTNITNDDNINYVDESNNKEDAINELKSIEEELKYEKLLEEMNKKEEQQIKDEKTEELKNSNLNNYETDLEENAIISYNELVKLSDSIYDENENKRIEDEGNEPITIEELKNKFNTAPIVKKEVTLMDFSVDKKFVSTPFISPIYGIEESKRVNEEINDLEQTANIEKYEIEIRKTNEFLKTLKELKEKLNF